MHLVLDVVDMNSLEWLLGIANLDIHYPSGCEAISPYRLAVIARDTLHIYVDRSFDTVAFALQWNRAIKMMSGCASSVINFDSLFDIEIPGGRYRDDRLEIPNSLS